jgi:SAM-dependent methyltransferase
VEQFFGSIRGPAGLSILDFASVSQANVNVITGLGHRICSDDFLLALDTTFGDGDFFANQADPDRAARFLRQTLDFAGNTFDGVLVWDALQYLDPALLKVVVDRLYRILKPGAYLLAFFHGEEKAETIPVYAYRVADEKTLQLSVRDRRRPAQLFNNRSLEKLFQQFQSVKFFLARDQLREVIVKR